MRLRRTTATTHVIVIIIICTAVSVEYATISFVDLTAAAAANSPRVHQRPQFTISRQCCTWQYLKVRPNETHDYYVQYILLHNRCFRFDFHACNRTVFNMFYWFIATEIQTENGRQSKPTRVKARAYTRTYKRVCVCTNVLDETISGEKIMSFVYHEFKYPASVARVALSRRDWFSFRNASERLRREKKKSTKQLRYYVRACAFFAPLYRDLIKCCTRKLYIIIYM